MDRLKKYGFKDENGHPLENCADYLAIFDENKADLEQAEAENTRLQKMVDWLAGQLHGLGPKYGDVICPQEKCHATSDCIDCWAESARRAVAAGEETCQK